MAATTPTASPTPLETPITGGGIRSVHFFNGRLLSGEDLTREQEAVHQADLRLGRAIGAGVVRGLEVSEPPGGSPSRSPLVAVSAGLAVNRLGQTLELAGRTELALAHREPGAAAATDLLFSDCVPIESGTYSAGSGVYLLTIGPSRTTEGRAPVSGLGNPEAACDTAFSVEGVQFRLIKVLFPASVMSDAKKARNRIAYRFLGTASPERRRLESDFFGPTVDRYGLVDDLASRCLDEHQVPLAVIHWTAAAGIVFVDCWAVRRRASAAAASTDFPLLAGERVEREGEAMVLQFQHHVGQVLDGPNRHLVNALDRFDHLPPFGVIPLGDPTFTGFNYLEFFSGLPFRTELAVIEGARVREIFRDALAYPPIELSRKEHVWLYLVRQNVEPPAGGAAAPRPFLIFTNGQISYRGDARYELSYWNFSNYAEVD